MGRKASSGGVRPRGNRIEVRFTWEGKQVSPTLDLRPTAANLKHAARLRATIVEEINQGKFRFAEHFPDYKNLTAVQPATDEESRLFRDWAKVWGRLSARGLEHSSHAVYLRHLAAYWLPGLRPPAAGAHYARHGARATGRPVSPRLDEKTGKTRRALARKTQNNILIPLRGCSS